MTASMLLAVHTKAGKFRNFVQPVVRPLILAVSMALLSLSILLTSDIFGLSASAAADLRETRKIVVETLAVQLSRMAGTGDMRGIRDSVSLLVIRNNDVRAASLTRENGVVVAEFGDVQRIKKNIKTSSITHLIVPIYNGSHLWGEAQVVFTPPRSSGESFKWYVFVLLASVFVFTGYLARALVQLDPDNIVPGRVDSAMNMFSAGVYVLDSNLRIVMVNDSGIKILGTNKSGILGKYLDNWPWVHSEGWQAPWLSTYENGTPVSDVPLCLYDGEARRSFLVSCSFVGDASQEHKGVLVTMDDMTTLERQNRELTTTLERLRKTQKLIKAKNQELHKLATTDSLTGLANRRTLMEFLTSNLTAAKDSDQNLACIMTDIDHFKQVNDNYGHAAGDEVIKAFADVLNDLCRKSDIVGRYGGEEFAVVLPGCNAAEAMNIAEKGRLTLIAVSKTDRVVVPLLSASFGVADLSSEPDNADDLLNAADLALYEAKKAGRNQVVKYLSKFKDAAEEAQSEKVQVQPSSSDNDKTRILELEARLKQKEHQLNVLGEFDPLTGIPLRTILIQQTEAEIKRALRDGTCVGIISFALRDLDKLVSTFGHIACDELVKAVVERLHTGLRTTDLVTNLSADHALSRITSNEYGILLSSLNNETGASIVVTRLKRLFAKPFEVSGEKVYIGVDIGIALSSADHCQALSLFADASEARRTASQKPEKISYAFASKRLNEKTDDYIRLETDLHEALQKGEIQTWFQPKYDIRTRQIIGVEALLRWTHDKRGLISPQVVVSVAEANGLIDNISELTIDNSLAQLKLWQSMGFGDLTVSVNVSPMQLRVRSLTDNILKAIENSGIKGDQLEIELTETSIFENPAQARTALEDLKRSGVKVSMDDFGTGYTSLSLLTDLPLDIVKIDRIFIDSIDSNVRSQAVVKSVIDMAHALGMKVIAEGVETQEQLDAIADLGCDAAQGYLISRPLDPSQITNFLVRHRAGETDMAA